MSKNKKAAAPAKQEDLSVSGLPGGNKAFWRSHRDLTPRQLRELTIYDTVTMPRMIQLVNDRKVIGPDGQPLTDPEAMGMPIGLTPSEARSFQEMNDVAVWAFLKGWTLHRGAEQVPLPGSADAVLDVPGGQEMYQALCDHAAKLNAERYRYGATSGNEFSQAAGFAEVEGADEIPMPGSPSAANPTGAFSE